jgi:hypothetical protein
MKYLATLVAFFLLSPVAFAANHTYICSETPNTQGSGVACSGNNWTTTNVGAGNYKYSNSPDPNFTWSNGVTYYFKVTSTGDSGTWQVHLSDITDNNNTMGTIAGTATDYTFSFAPTLVGTGRRFYVGDPTAVATVTSVCVSNVSFADCPNTAVSAVTTLTPILSLVRAFWIIQ